MAAQKLPDNLTKISYILDRKDKEKLQIASIKAGRSMSDMITDALREAGVFGSRHKPKAA